MNGEGGREHEFDQVNDPPLVPHNERSYDE